MCPGYVRHLVYTVVILLSYRLISKGQGVLVFRKGFFDPLCNLPSFFCKSILFQGMAVVID